MVEKKHLKKITDYLYEIPKSFRSDMRVPARIYINQEMLEQIFEDRSLEQLINISTLPGIEKYAYAMPDIHEGYGFPIGGVAAMRERDGVVSPGGVGYDINCGVRLLLSKLNISQARPHLLHIANQLMRDIPSGVGRGGPIKLSDKEMDDVLNSGVEWARNQGYALSQDLERIEEGGRMKQADADKVSLRAKSRGRDQLGTLGSGNHFLEIERVAEIYDEKTAQNFGLFKDQVVVMIHTGSRGLGHQVCTDYVRIMLPRLAEWGIVLPDRELACAPIGSPEGRAYLAAMAAACNFAWTNRQLITYWTRRAWTRILGPHNLNTELQILYDVAHNIAKYETHGGERYWVHRKGATRAFGPAREELAEIYKKTGQPVLIPGSMGTSSYVLVGTASGMQETFGTVCHGAGRTMSRHKAKRMVSGSELRKRLEAQGIIVRCQSSAGLAEEAPIAYKDVNQIVDTVHKAGIANKIAKLKPLAVIKGG